MKIQNLALVLGMSAALGACGSSSKIVEPSDLNNQRVFFAFDSSAITEESRNNLLGQALYMKNRPDVKVTIEGHTDERGTAEYNLALGARRANAAKSVIVKDGVDAGRIQTVSYGKSRPIAKGSNEAAWAQNRNATTVVR